MLDELQFAADLEANRGLLMRTCQCFLITDIEDAVQDAMLLAWRYRNSFEGRANLKTWLVTIARNRCLEILRKQKRRHYSQHEELKEDSAVCAPSQELEFLFDERRSILARLKIQLSPVQRRMVEHVSAGGELSSPYYRLIKLRAVRKLRPIIQHMAA